MPLFKLITASLLLFSSVLLPSTTVYAHETSTAHAEPLIMGIVPHRNATATMKLFRPLQQYLAKHLEREVRLVTTKNFKTFWQGVKQQKYDLVNFNQYHYIISHKKHAYQVILKSEERGEGTIAGGILVRKDSGIESVNDLKGKKIVFGGGPKGMMSYIVPTYLLRQAGLNAGDYEEAFAKNPPNAILSAYYGQAAAAGSADKLFHAKAVRQQIDRDKMRFLLRSEPLPQLPWAVKGNMDQNLLIKIQTLLKDLKHSEEGQALLRNAHMTGFQVASDADYDPHRDILRSLYGDDFEH